MSDQRKKTAVVKCTKLLLSEKAREKFLATSSYSVHGVRFQLSTNCLGLQLSTV
jgi:hypothetical protein